MGFQNLADVHPRRHPQRMSTTSTGVPSAMCGMSSIGVILEITPLLPVAARHLSPGWSLRLTAR